MTSGLNAVDTEYCAKCRFWMIVDREGIGNCRRHAPVIDDHGNGWPNTCGHEWCGDFAKLEIQSEAEQ